MDIITITDNDINEVIAVYTLEKFLEEVNKDYNEYNEDEKHFTLNTIDSAIDWYIETGDNLSLDRYTVEDINKKNWVVRSIKLWLKRKEIILDIYVDSYKNGQL